MTPETTYVVQAKTDRRATRGAAAEALTARAANGPRCALGTTARMMKTKAHRLAFPAVAALQAGPR
jgi:hypothetical protein